MCHVAFPKLNEFGRDYAGNGYQFPGEDPKGRAIETGLRNVKFLAEYTHDLLPVDASHPEKAYTEVLGVVLAY